MIRKKVSEAGHSISDKPFIKKSHPLINKNVSPQGHVLSSNAQDSKILCKRIDNSTLNVPTKNEQEALGQKFVPLAFPLEKMKKKTTHSQSQAVSQESKSKNTSVPHSVNISGQPSRNQSMPQVLGKAPNASGYNLTFNLAEAGNLPEPKGLKAIKKSKANQSMEEIPKASSIEYGERTTSPLKSKENKVLKLRKRSAKKSSGNIKKVAKENIVVGDMRPKSRMSVGGQFERENEEGKIKHKPSEEKIMKSAKGSKNSSPTKSQIEKKEKRKVKKREQVSKSEIPAAFEEMIQKSAHEYMEDLRAKKHMSDLEKVMYEEKKAALEQGNKMIRISNLQRFNPPVHHQESVEEGQSRFAWGVDQRKFEKKNERQGSKTPPPRKKIDDRERRKVLGLDHFDERKLQQRKSVKEKNTSQREASEEKKSKRELDKNDHVKIQEYMYQKRAKIEQEKHEKQHEANEEFDRKRRNLEQLFFEIRYNREKDFKQPKSKSKKRPKSRKTHKSSLSPARVSQREDLVRKGESMIYHQHEINEINEDNYQALYNEYMNIRNAKTKKKSRDVSPNDRSSTRNRQRNQSAEIYREEQNDVGDHYQHSSGRNVRESQRLKAKYHELRQRESEVSGEYTSQNTLNRNPLESSPHKTTQKEVSPIKKKKTEKVVYEENKAKKSRRSQQLTGSDAQDIIIEMETDNFSDNDNLRSERMIIRDRYERPIIEEEDFSNPGFRTYDNIPIESTREVMEAAAIFIQKNYRGYRTRKLIKMYFDQICREGLDFTDEEERHADEDEDDVDNRYEDQRRSHNNKGGQQDLIKVQDERYSSHKGKKQQAYEESSEEEEEEESERKKDQFLDPNEKKSIYDLLERQKRLIGQEESEQQTSKRQEGEDEEEYYERKLREIQDKIDAGEKLTYEEVSSAKQSDLDSQLAKADYMKYLEQLGQMNAPGSESEDFKQSGGADSQEIDSEQYYQQMEYLRFRDQIHSQLVGMKEKYAGSPGLKEGEQDLRRIKSDGERGDKQGTEEVYGDSEDSDQISLHHDYMRKEYLGTGRSNNDIPKNSVSVSERDTGSYAEEFRSSMPEATPIKEGHSRSATKQGFDHNQLVQVPTVESMTIPTRSVIESQLFMNPSIHKELHKGKEVDYSLGNMDLSTSQAHAQAAQRKDAQALAQIKSNSSVASNVIGPQSKKSSDSNKQTSSGRRAADNISSKKTPENVLLDKKRISFPVQESSDSSRKKTLTKSESDQFRDQLISELKAMEEEKSDHKIKQKPPGKETLIDNFVNNNKPIRKIKQIEKSSSGSRQDREYDYQNELVRLREEQAKQWNEVLKQLNALKTEENTELNEKVREFIENLANQSEINKRRLIDSVELQNIIKTQSGQSDEKSIINDLDSLMKNNQYTLPTENQVTVQTPKDDDLVVVKETQGSAKREKKDKSSSEKKTSTKKKSFQFGKKINLEINVDLVNDEKTEQSNTQAAAEAAGLEEIGLDLGHMRMALGSEQLMREQSQRTLTQSISTPSELGSLNNLKTPDNMDGLVNLFGRDPFQEFANKRFKELMSQDSMKQLIQMREQALEVRHKAHIESINKMFENRKFSPRTFQNKKIELEKWVNKERDNIQKSRKDIEKGWTSTQDSIKKTQRDLEFLNKVAAHSGSKSSAQKIDERSIEPSNRTATKDLTRSPIAKFILPEDSIQSESSKKNREEEPGLRYIDDIQLELRSPPGEKKTPNKFSPSARSASKYDTIKSDSSYPGTRTEDLTIDTTELGNKEIRSRKPIGSPHIESDNTGSSKYLNQSESVIETTNVGFDNKFISSRLSTQKEDKPLEIPSRISPQNANKAKERRNKLAPLEPEGHEAAVVSLTPKTPQELRNLFNEQVEALKASTSNPDLTQKVLEEAGKQTSQKALETVDVEVNLQKKVDMITEEVFNCLFDELGKELGKPEKERVAGKVKGIDDHNPVLGKQQLAENKEFFTHGAEKHHNFQANIPIIPAAIVEHEKLDEVHDIIKEEERIYDELERYENLYDQGVIRENNSSQPIKSDEQERLLDDDQIKQQQQQQQVLFDTQAEIFRNLAIKTDLKSLENYLDMLLAEIKGTYMDEFLTNINIPIGLNIGEKLNNMHAYDLAGSESSLEMSDGLQRAILSIHLYLKVEEALMEQNPSRNEVITELEHIHNKMVFDCLNEILDFYRPHGLVGEPYPWKLSVRVQKPATIAKSHVERILRECKKKVMEWAAFMCGYYGERDDFIRDRTNSYAEEYLAQIKEERLSKMLAAEVYEMEDKWINYDDEEAEVELEISDLVFDKLVTETAELIMRINEQRGGPKRPSPERKLKIQQDDKKRRKKSL